MAPAEDPGLAKMIGRAMSSSASKGSRPKGIAKSNLKKGHHKKFAAKRSAVVSPKSGASSYSQSGSAIDVPAPLIAALEGLQQPPKSLLEIFENSVDKYVNLYDGAEPRHILRTALSNALDQGRDQLIDIDIEKAHEAHHRQRSRPRLMDTFAALPPPTSIVKDPFDGSQFLKQMESFAELTKRKFPGNSEI